LTVLQVSIKVQVIGGFNVLFCIKNIKVAP
jgi:hypothetical protein